MLEEYLGEPAQFNVYTHNSANPLIKSMTLISPSQIKYFRRSDSMLTVKILTLPVHLNEVSLHINNKILQFLSNLILYNLKYGS